MIKVLQWHPLPKHTFNGDRLTKWDYIQTKEWGSIGKSWTHLQQTLQQPIWWFFFMASADRIIPLPSKVSLCSDAWARRLKGGDGFVRVKRRDEIRACDYVGFSTLLAFPPPHPLCVRICHLLRCQAPQLMVPGLLAFTKKTNTISQSNSRDIIALLRDRKRR